MEYLQGERIQTSDGVSGAKYRAVNQINALQPRSDRKTFLIKETGTGNPVWREAYFATNRNKDQILVLPATIHYGVASIALQDQVLKVETIDNPIAQVYRPQHLVQQDGSPLLKGTFNIKEHVPPFISAEVFDQWYQKYASSKDRSYGLTFPWIDNFQHLFQTIKANNISLSETVRIGSQIARYYYLLEKYGIYQHDLAETKNDNFLLFRENDQWQVYINDFDASLSTEVDPNILYNLNNLDPNSILFKHIQANRKFNPYAYQIFWRAVALGPNLELNQILNKIHEINAENHQFTYSTTLKFLQMFENTVGNQSEENQIAFLRDFYTNYLENYVRDENAHHFQESEQISLRRISEDGPLYHEITQTLQDILKSSMGTSAQLELENIINFFNRKNLSTADFLKHQQAYIALVLYKYADQIPDLLKDKLIHLI
jgi:hypothetical protein